MEMGQLGQHLNTYHYVVISFSNKTFSMAIEYLDKRERAIVQSLSTQPNLFLGPPIQQCYWEMLRSPA